MEDENVQINLADQLTGEVQGFIYVMRWLVYEFYQFKKLRQLGFLMMSDFEALEEDVLFILNKLVVTKEVHETLLILSRLNKNKADKRLREKYRLIHRYQSKYFPLEVNEDLGSE